MDSAAFSLPNRPGPVFIDARGGSKFGYWTGVGMSIGGAAFTFMGASLLLLASDMSKNDPTTVDGKNADRQSALTLGTVVIITGLVVGLVGLGIWHRNKMKVEVH